MNGSERRLVHDDDPQMSGVRSSTSNELAPRVVDEFTHRSLLGLGARSFAACPGCAGDRDDVRPRLNHPCGCGGTPLGVESCGVCSQLHRRPISVALVDDYDVVLKGVAHMFDNYRDRVVVAEIDANMSVSDPVDVSSYRTVPQPESDHQQIAELIDNSRAHHVSSTPGTFSRNSSTPPADWASTGICPRRFPPPISWLRSKRSSRARSSSATNARGASALGLDWPGRREGITDRESEILALITQGRATPRSHDSHVSARTPSSPTSAPSTARSVPRAESRPSSTASVTASRRIAIGSSTGWAALETNHGVMPGRSPGVADWRLPACNNCDGAEVVLGKLIYGAPSVVNRLRRPSLHICGS